MRHVHLLAAAAALAWQTGASAQQVEPRPAPAITVIGDGVATVVPDLAIVTSGVVTRAPAAGAALEANSAAMAKALAALKDAKVEDRDVGTSGLTVQPQYDYGDDAAGRTPKLAGYEVRNTVTIRVRDLDRLGGLLDALVAAGSNQIEGLAFDVSDRSKRLDEARRAAMDDARRKAALLAAGADSRLGAVLSIEEQDIAPDQPVRAFASRAKAMDAAAAVPIARGEQELRARVAVRWEIVR